MPAAAALTDTRERTHGDGFTLSESEVNRRPGLGADPMNVITGEISPPALCAPCKKSIALSAHS